MRVVAYLIILAFSISILVLPICKAKSNLRAGAKVVLWVAGGLGLLWVALGVQENWGIFTIPERTASLLRIVKTLACGIAVGMLASFMLLGGLKENVRVTDGRGAPQT